MPICVRSEINKLKTVLLHRPGCEIENLTPDLLERLLFDDIPWLAEAQREHDAFAQTLRDNGVEVLYLHELVAEVLKNDEVKKEFLNQFIEEANIKNNSMKELVYNFLNNYSDTEELVRKTMAGINKNELTEHEAVSLAEMADDSYPFIVDPMPNLYFTRDPFASIGDKVSLNKMYSVTRSRETIYGEYIFKYHPRFSDVQKVYDRYFDFSIEGGDILNINEKVLAVGISQRTKADGVEKIARELFFNTPNNKIETVLAFNIPKSRAFMHLDTVFTQVDYDKFTIHPGIQGPLEVFEITKGEKENELCIEKVTMELEKILAKHMNLDKVTLIPCGGGDRVVADREQWNDGSNTLAIAPGEVIVYSRNYVTNELLQSYGIKTHIIPSSELSRGRGGPRCMSMPLEREE